MTIFDDLVQGISKEISRVQERSQEMMQGYSLKSQVRTLEGRKTAAFLEIGRMIYEKYQRGSDITDDALKAKTEEIVGYEHEITILNAELESLKAVLDPDAPASQKSEAKAGYKPTPGHDCPACGAPTDRNKTFCPSCGECIKSKESGEPAGAGRTCDGKPDGNGDHMDE